jgi:hypothetical protein
MQHLVGGYVHATQDGVVRRATFPPVYKKLHALRRQFAFLMGGLVCTAS